MSALKYWLWLSLKRGISRALQAALIDGLGSPENVYLAGREELEACPGITPEAIETLSIKSLDNAERTLELCDMTFTKLITMQDAAYPERLRGIYDPPGVLYYRGNLPAMDEEAAVGIVGTRRPTAYGQSAAMRLGYELAKAGMLVVSGMALGIDGLAQTGALRAGKPTIAVLGSGPDVIYPSENRALYEDIVAAGAVISEYPPGERPDRASFPARNRIISGLSLGVLLIEAPSGSGSLITANHALDQGRDVFCVPGGIDSPESAGTNRLIREGAMLVTCAEDIVSEYRALFSHKLNQKPIAAPRDMPAPRPLSGAAKKRGEAKEEVKVFDLTELIEKYGADQKRILLAIGAAARTADEIIELTSLPAQLALSELTMLELDGIITQTPGHRFKLTIGD